VAAATIKYGFKAPEQAYVFKCNGQKIVLSVTNPACAKFMKYLANLQDIIQRDPNKVVRKKSGMVADIEAPYTITATDAAEQWEMLNEAYRAVQGQAGSSGGPVPSAE
jgi:hypothetical protein